MGRSISVTVLAAVLLAGTAGAQGYRPYRDRYALPLYQTRDPDTRDAVDTCVAAIEAAGNRQAVWAEVTSITTVAHVGTRFSINGRVMLHAAPDAPGEKHVFRCRLKPGIIEKADIGERS